MNISFIKQTRFSAYSEVFVPADGLLILFPSWLRHSVPKNQSDKRYTIGFNTVWSGIKNSDESWLGWSNNDW
jgi:hypothetical protein